MNYCIADTFRLFLAPEQIVELRGLNVGNKKVTYSGLFDYKHLPDAARAATMLEDAHATGVYFTLNPPKSTAMRLNTCKPTRNCTKDADILCRRWLLIDADPIRPADCSATDAEKLAALEVIGEVQRYLCEELDAPADAMVLCDSGNGYHLLCRIDLPADDGGIVKAVLHALGERFDTDAAKIDRSVFNPSRITKLYGTLARKGENTAERPHRRSCIVDAPDGGVCSVVSRSSLERWAGAGCLSPENPSAPQPLSSPASTPDFDRDKLIRRAEAYAKSFDSAISGQHGHNTTLRFASAIVNGLCFTEGEAWLILLDFNSRKCEPKWSERELRHKLNEAIKLGPPEGKHRGWLLLEERRDPQDYRSYPPFQEDNLQPNAPVFNANGSEEANPNKRQLSSRGPCKPSEQATPSVETYYGSEKRPRPPDSRVYHGLAGEITEIIDPQTEADRIAVLAQFLVMFGNYIGRGPYYLIEGARHYCNLFLAIVGKTGRGRKGVSKHRALEVFRGLGDEWHMPRPGKGSFAEGIQSGEAIVALVRDQGYNSKLKKDANGAFYLETMPDPNRPNVEDKRLVIHEEEFARILGAINREGCSISPVMRKAWDSGNLAVITKANSDSATNAHTSAVVHVTPEELLLSLKNAELMNGFANRFLWIYCERSKELPEGGGDVDLTEQIRKLRDCIEIAQLIGKMEQTRAALESWHQIYKSLTSTDESLTAGILARGAPQVRRLAMIYALLDGSALIDVQHLDAAYHLWLYCERTVRWVYGDTLGDRMADIIIRELKDIYPNGIKKSDLHALFRNHCSGVKLEAALDLLFAHRQIKTQKIRGENGGRPASYYFALCGHAPRLWTGGTNGERNAS